MLAAIAAGALLVAWEVSAAKRAHPEAGKETAKQVCQACHGMDGISLIRNYPNLAGQKELYMIKQLKAFRSNERVSVEMNATAALLTDQEILDVAAYYSRLK
jgi:cytochrome c553